MPHPANTDTQRQVLREMPTRIREGLFSCPVDSFKGYKTLLKDDNPPRTFAAEETQMRNDLFSKIWIVNFYLLNLQPYPMQEALWACRVGCIFHEKSVYMRFLFGNS